MAAIVGMLAACASPPAPNSPADVGPLAAPPVTPVPPQPAPPSPPPAADVIERTASVWSPVDWAELPGFDADALDEAWNAWLKSCERPALPWRGLCDAVRRLSLGSDDEKRAWMRQTLQPYRITPRSGTAQTAGLLTAYYEPVLTASRQRTAEFTVPLYAPPAGRPAGQPWFTRQDIDTLPQARAALRGREIAWLNDPVDALILHIQGSGRLQVREADGQLRAVRLAFAGTNDQPYRSVGKWLLDQGLVRDASWPGIKAWIARNPQRLNELLWSNPRVVFFREEPLQGLDAAFGPRGAQGVPLTPGRSIAVDPLSIPYGTPVWLSSAGPQTSLNRLVLAQDTGSAIVGAVRADWFAGWGPEAGELAGRLKQPLALWALWPRAEFQKQ